MKLKYLNPCKYYSRIRSTTQKEWDKSKHDAMWLVSEAHSRGDLSRNQFIGLLLKTIEPVFSYMSEISLRCMKDLQRWLNKEYIDLKALRKNAYSAAHSAASTVYAARVAASTVYVATGYAAAAAAAAVGYVVDAASNDSEYVDVRKHVTCEEICSYLKIDKDEELV